MNAVVPVRARVRRRPRSCQTFAPETRTTSRRSAGTERPAAAAARSAAVSSAFAASRSLCVALLCRYMYQHKLAQVPNFSLSLSVCLWCGLPSELPRSWTEPPHLREWGDRSAPHSLNSTLKIQHARLFRRNPGKDALK